MTGEAHDVCRTIRSFRAVRIEQFRIGNSALKRDELKISGQVGSGKISRSQIGIVHIDYILREFGTITGRVGKGACAGLMIVVKDGGMAVAAPFAHARSVINMRRIAFTIAHHAALSGSWSIIGK